MAFRNVQIDIEDAIFQTALNRATAEGKAISQVIGEFLKQYAEGATTGAPTSYTVQSGDTLGKIAFRVYGDAHKYTLIQQANNLSDPSRIWVGQVLIIPPASDGGPVASPPPAPGPVTSSPRPAPAPPAPTPAGQAGAPAGSEQPRPSIRWVGSPNFNSRSRPDDITAITIHATANSTLKGVIDWFNNPHAMVSAHYTIDKDGTIVQHVKDSDRAWHAGQSAWKGRQSCNDYCLGIELVNLNDGQDPYPEAQHQANVSLCAYLCYTYHIATTDIMGHLDICLPPGRKSDPKGYDLERLRREVATLLEAKQ
jgi:LysM repeat protein